MGNDAVWFVRHHVFEKKKHPVVTWRKETGNDVSEECAD